MPIVCYSNSAQEKSTLTVFNCVSRPRTHTKRAPYIYKKEHIHISIQQLIITCFHLFWHISLTYFWEFFSFHRWRRCRCRRHHQCRCHHFQECLGIVLGAKTQLSLHFNVYFNASRSTATKNASRSHEMWHCRMRINKILVKFSINFSITNFWCFWISSSLLITQSEHVNNCRPTAKELKMIFIYNEKGMNKARFTYTVRF